MGISYNEVVYRKGVDTNFTDSSVNGGKPGDIVVTDVLNSIFPEVTATEREDGVTRRVKMFISNESTDRTMKDTLISIGQDVLPPERLRLFEATEKSQISFLTDEDLNGEDSVISAGTNISIKDILPAGLGTDDLVGRRVFVGNSVFNIDDNPSSTEITFSEDIAVNIPTGTKLSADDVFDSVEDDEAYTDSNAFLNSVTMSTFQSGVSSVDIPIIEKEYFPVGRDFIVLDGYYRTIFRATVSDIQDNDSDDNLATITMSKEYTGSTTIPSREGFVSGAIKRDIKPNETKSFWLELIVSPEGSVEDESVNQFQISTYFDDVTA